ncbi:bifunctional 2-polyprenyl-6-hydroxyphenol methylase/3-demethylubiquinol 3-O-methyltransferase UbiG [Actinomadura sp. WMMB 499]|uniref:class I SAM-dependent methyltransferase n=1 Tax=Actinomadura sp. WMMB 499 TaxID=1219491 RepID=UPI001247F1C9|nr:class I SAM-dependent methyltransferase [Actinomadura sp. WMMB 499]QFG20815.1 class I SAM-dependent methyltransferase [Actinomadura sp. WMMB 499]
MSNETEEFWEEHYRARDRVWSGNPNPVMVGVVEALDPGTALDLGCGEGADAVWLARRGWRVTAVDVSAVALERAAAHAAEAGVDVEFQRHDLGHGFPKGSFDLVSAQFLQSPLDWPRAEILRSAAAAVAPGGLLLIVEHGAAPPWSKHHHDHRFPTADETFADLALDPAAWTTERCGVHEREATGPDGQTGTLLDNVIAVRRTGP